MRLEEVAKSGWGQLLSVTNAIEAGTCRQGDSGWAEAGQPGGGWGRGNPPPCQCTPPPPSARSSVCTVLRMKLVIQTCPME